VLASFSPNQHRLTERVSKGQLYCSTVLFLLGTTWIFVPGSDLGRDAWVTAVLGLLSGLPLILLYNRISALFPGKTPAEWLPQLCGKFLGTAICLLYSWYFLYIAARNVRDVAELLKVSFLNRTPIIAICLVQGLIIGLASYYGVETSGRANMVLFPAVMLMLGFIMLALLQQSRAINLVPVLEYGLLPVWHYSFPLATLVPYGECVVMLFYLPFVSGRPQKTLIAATLTGGGLLILVTFMAVLVLGPANLVNSALPFYSLIRKISMGGFINRLDALILPMISFTAYVKATKLMLGASYTLARLQGASRPGRLALPLGLLIGGWGIFMAGSFAEQLEVGLKMVTYAYHIPLTVLLPLALWLFAEWRRHRGHLPQDATGQRHELPPRWSQIAALLLALVVWTFAILPSAGRTREVTQFVMNAIGQVVGQPVVRLLGGHMPNE
jgi:spore germination protein KB